MVIGMSIWIGAVLLVGISTSFWLLVVGRTLTGIGEASFVTLAPPYILKIAPLENKTLWLAIFFVSFPVGYAIGFVFGQAVSDAFGN